MKDAINVRLVKALLRKSLQERHSMFKRGNFDVLGFLFRLVLTAAIVALFVVFFGRFADVYTAVRTNGVTDIPHRTVELLTILYTAVIAGMTIGSVGQLGRELFTADDVKLFAGMPIGAKTLYLAKFIIIYINQLVISAVAVLAVNLTLALHVAMPWHFWVFSVILWLVLPLIAIAVGSVLVFPFQAVKRFLSERPLILLLVLTVLLGVAFWLYSLILTGAKELLLGDSLRYFFNERIMTSIGKAVSWLYPARWFASILTGTSTVVDWVGLILVIALGLLVSLLLIRYILQWVLQSRNAGPSNHLLKSGRLTKGGSRFGALIKKEFLAIFRTPSYLFSYFSVAVVMPLMVYFCMDLGVSLVDKLVGLTCNLELAIFLTILFGALTNIFCATNISRDGEMFYTVKAMPLGYRQVFFSKIVLCLVVTAFSQIASAALLFFTGNVAFPDALFLILIGMLFSFVNIAVATRYDFNHARFSTEEDSEIKGLGGTVSVVIILGMVIAFAVGGLIFVLRVLGQFNQIPGAAWLTYVAAAGAAVLATALALFYLLWGLRKKYYEFTGGGL